MDKSQNATRGGVPLLAHSLTDAYRSLPRAISSSAREMGRSDDADGARPLQTQRCSVRARTRAPHSAQTHLLERELLSRAKSGRGGSCFA